jgi:hypothetical protein
MRSWSKRTEKTKMETQANKGNERPDWVKTKTVENWDCAPGNHLVVVLEEKLRTLEYEDDNGKPIAQEVLSLLIEISPTKAIKTWNINWMSEFGTTGKLGQLKAIALKKSSLNLVGSVLRVVVVGEGKNKRYTILDETPKAA